MLRSLVGSEMSIRYKFILVAVQLLQGDVVLAARQRQRLN